MGTYSGAVLQGVHRAGHMHVEAPVSYLTETGAVVWFLGEQSPFQKHLFLEMNLLRLTLNARVHTHGRAH